jgi:hypothetical protein
MTAPQRHAIINALKIQYTEVHGQKETWNRDVLGKYHEELGIMANCVDILQDARLLPVISTEEMVNRFLFWKLPASFNPDGGVKFTPYGDPKSSFWPVGTNLLNAEEARKMIGHILGLA